ncbi:hypothetical protein [Rhodococcus pyridinivorans]|uniref:hypothetical protein n=1 Tax=Rhodococcus pyridinivorans TaxID=103816 RepID=UPI00265A5F0D|nr:hypothetical protein [Rhodococcus pyridinivorans]
MRIAPELGPIIKKNGIAGQFSFCVSVTYPGESPQTVEFVGRAQGETVVMCHGGEQTFVDDPGRFGDFSPEWVRRFYAA